MSSNALYPCLVLSNGLRKKSLFKSGKITFQVLATTSGKICFEQKKQQPLELELSQGKPHTSVSSQL